MPDSLRILTTIAGFTAFCGLLGWYLTARAGWAFSLPARARHALAVLLAASLGMAIASRTLGIEHAALARWLGLFGGAAMMAIVISCALLMPIDLARLLTWLLRRKARGESLPEQPARRAFLAQAASGSAIALGSGAAVYGAIFGRRDYTIETVPIVLEKLPRALDGLTIVQLSDIHVGTFIGERELAAALSLVREAKPDLIVLTGDLIDHDARYAPELGRFARKLEGVARFGVHAIPGNHDYYGGVEATVRALQQGGAEVLVNRHVRIGDAGAGILLGGLDDVAARHYGRVGPDPQRAFAGADPELARVQLSHNPSTFGAIRSHADLTLSGHTHGGQITLFVNPAELVLAHGLVRGHYHVGDSQLYVNRGFGTAGPPVRVGSPPEVSKLVLSARA